VLPFSQPGAKFLVVGANLTEVIVGLQCRFDGLDTIRKLLVDMAVIA